MAATAARYTVRITGSLQAATLQAGSVCGHVHSTLKAAYSCCRQQPTGSHCSIVRVNMTPLSADERHSLQILMQYSRQQP